MPVINIMYLALSADGSQVVDTASASNANIQSLESLGWSAPNGRLFVEWNTKADGSGTSYSAGDLATSSMSLYTIWGEPAVNKVVLGTETLLDLTGDTATAADVAVGKTFHLASGVQAVGTASGGSSGVSVFYGTCATAAATAAKVVVCEGFTSSDLVEGTVINVKFANAQTYNGAPTLNVNSTGAKNIRITENTNAGRYEWVAGEMLQFVYDGTYWVVTDGGRASTTYYGSVKLSSATNSTSTALAATASAVKAAYDQASSGGAKSTWYGTSDTAASTAIKVVTCDGYANEVGCIVGILFSTANTNLTPQLRINDGARGYIITGAAATSPITWEANSMVYVMFNGLDYQLIGVVPQGGASLPIATASTLGGIKVGSGLSITSDGTLSASGGGGGSSQWTDISSLAWTFSVEDVATIHAKTNGSLVCISADVSGFDFNEGSFIVYPPSGYEPSHICVTQFTSETNAEYSDLVGNVVASTSGAIYMALTNPDAYSIDEVQSFTLIYPIA